MQLLTSDSKRERCLPRPAWCYTKAVMIGRGGGSQKKGAIPKKVPEQNACRGWMRNGSGSMSAW